MSLDEAFFIPVFLLYAFGLAGGTLALLSAIGSYRLRKREERLRQWRIVAQIARGFDDAIPPRQPHLGPQR